MVTTCCCEVKEKVLANGRTDRAGRSLANWQRERHSHAAPTKRRIVGTRKYARLVAT